LFGTKEDKKPAAQKGKKNESLLAYKSFARNDSCCEVDSDDLDGDLNLSDCEDGEARRTSFKASRREKKKTRAANKYVVEVDTNIFKVSLSCLKNAGVMATGDPVLCQKCKAVLSIHSVLKPIMGKDSKMWKCEFCY
jgi:hypothetical protein